MGARRLAATAAAPLVLLALCASASASEACPADVVEPTTDTAPAAALAVLCDVNVVRAEHGLRPLRWDSRLSNGARKLAADMAAHNYFSHVTPDGLRLEDRIRPTGYIAGWSTLLTENLGWGTNALSSPLSIVLGWMDSAGHRRNVLDPAMRDMGVGVAEGAVSEGGPTGVIYVADFGRRGTARASVHKRWPSRSFSKVMSSSASSALRTTTMRFWS